MEPLGWGVAFRGRWLGGKLGPVNTPPFHRPTGPPPHHPTTPLPHFSSSRTNPHATPYHAILRHAHHPTPPHPTPHHTTPHTTPRSPQIGLEDFLFNGMDEAVGRPMERVLFERTRELLAHAAAVAAVAAAAAGHDGAGLAGGGVGVGEGRGSEVVARFGALRVDETRNAENDVVSAI